MGVGLEISIKSILLIPYLAVSFRSMKAGDLNCLVKLVSISTCAENIGIAAHGAI